MTKEEAIKILQNIYFEVPEIKEVLQIAIETLSRLSPPSNLDEAAEETAKKYYCSCLEKHNETGICDGCENVKLSFKAGAEWMAGQGEVFDGFMSVKGKRSLIAIKGSSQNFKYGDNVIVQIRKKQ